MITLFNDIQENVFSSRSTLVNETVKVFEFKSEAVSYLSGTSMAGYNKYDLRLESLVVEGVTLWDTGVDELSDDEKKTVAAEIHAHPELASKISYERTHTGFARVITVTIDDIARLYEHNITAE